MEDVTVQALLWFIIASTQYLLQGDTPARVHGQQLVCYTHQHM
jgi:hypothetical protein